MSHAALTAKYRPQTFADVAGQDTVKHILSRASLERKVAPAYLFSGTRGVGKTTLARIFAKALNCRNAPAAEPCNACDQCKAITLGSAVDVVEIDGASNRGIDDVRRLKEVVGYAPMEGGYKIFIIDEAHMLSREAFNALLKTLEEPPARVVFVMATTEPHKFPATIISRCQHYVFKPLSESGLVAHLSGVLRKETVAFEESAVRLIARRGAGSVRDSMSLLGQVLALDGGKLTENATRSVLGLAGQEAFVQLLESFKNGDSLTLARVLRDMLDQGLDIGFFLRELSSLWRNFFMLRQSGEAALSVVDVPDSEARQYLELCQGFSLQHIHACWQMTLEGQRRVLTSLEPALALELLLLNIAMLPKLLSLENISSLGRRNTPPSPGGSGNAGGGMPVPSSDTGKAAQQRLGVRSQSLSSKEPGEAAPPRAQDEPRSMPHVLQKEEKREEGVFSAQAATTPKESTAVRAGQTAPYPEHGDARYDGGADTDYDEAAIQEALREISLPAALPDSGLDLGPAAHAASTDERRVVADDGQEQALPSQKPMMSAPQEIAAEKSFAVHSYPEWKSIVPLCEDCELPVWFTPLLQRVHGEWKDGVLTLTTRDTFTVGRLRDSQTRELLDGVLCRWCGGVPEIAVIEGESRYKAREELKEEILEHPFVQQIQNQFDAYLIDYGQIYS